MLMIEPCRKRVEALDLDLLAVDGPWPVLEKSKSNWSRAALTEHMSSGPGSGDGSVALAWWVRRPLYVRMYDDWSSCNALLPMLCDVQSHAVSALRSLTRRLLVHGRGMVAWRRLLLFC